MLRTEGGTGRIECRHRSWTDRSTSPRAIHVGITIPQPGEPEQADIAKTSGTRQRMKSDLVCSGTLHPKVSSAAGFEGCEWSPGVNRQAAVTQWRGANPRCRLTPGTIDTWDKEARSPLLRNCTSDRAAPALPTYWVLSIAPQSNETLSAFTGQIDCTGPGRPLNRCPHTARVSEREIVMNWDQIQGQWK